MTKKTSLLLTGLFAVSSILSCHAMDKKFLESLGNYERERGHTLRLVDLNAQRTNDGPQVWDSGTESMFKNKYRPFVEKYKHTITELNRTAYDIINSIKGGDGKYLLPTDGTQYYEIQSVAKKIENQLLSGENIDKIKSDTVEMRRRLKMLTDLIDHAKEQGIDLNLSVSNNQPSKNADQKNAVPSTGGGSAKRSARGSAKRGGRY